MPRTHSDAIDELTKRVDALALALEGLRTLSTVEIEHFKGQIKELQTVSKEVQASCAKTAERIAALEERAKSLEKGTDRRWQFAPMVISGVGVVIALVALFVKR